MRRHIPFHHEMVKWRELRDLLIAALMCDLCARPSDMARIDFDSVLITTSRSKKVPSQASLSIVYRKTGRATTDRWSVTLSAALVTQRATSLPKKSCSVTLLRTYLDHPVTVAARKACVMVPNEGAPFASLFMYQEKESSGSTQRLRWQSLSRGRVSSVVKKLLRKALFPRTDVRVRDVRAMAASKAYCLGVPLVAVLLRAYWADERTFRKHYFIPTTFAVQSLSLSIEDILRTEVSRVSV